MSQKPKVEKTPKYRTPTYSQDPQTYDTKQIRIRFDLLDFEHDLLGLENLSTDQ